MRDERNPSSPSQEEKWQRDRDIYIWGYLGPVGVPKNIEPSGEEKTGRDVWPPTSTMAPSEFHGWSKYH